METSRRSLLKGIAASFAIGVSGVKLAIPEAKAAVMSPNATHQGWLICNGQMVSRETYKKLFQIVGTIYGHGDGAETFNLPDLRGSFLPKKDVSGENSDDLYSCQYAINPEDGPLPTGYVAMFTVNSQPPQSYTSTPTAQSRHQSRQMNQR